MEFDRSKIYTALNADELRIGSEVIAADNLRSLKEKVESGAETCIVEEICPDDSIFRFGTEHTPFAFAYLVSEPVEKALKWTDLNLLDRVVNKKTGCIAVVTAIDPGDETSLHVAFGPEWMRVSELKDWKKED